MLNIRFFLMLLTTCMLTIRVTAQSAEDSVRTVINTMFLAMKNADASALKNAFADKAMLQTISGREGKLTVVNEDVEAFANFIGQLKKDSADERLSFDVVRIDGPLAIAWAPYRFYYNGQFSHCGVNSFQLVRFAEGWKIVYLIDTRRRVGCE